MFRSARSSSQRSFCCLYVFGHELQCTITKLVLIDRDRQITYQCKNLFPRMRKNISKKKSLSFTHEIMRDTMRVGESVLTNDNRRISPRYLPVISHVCTHMIGF